MSRDTTLSSRFRRVCAQLRVRVGRPLFVRRGANSLLTSSSFVNTSPSTEVGNTSSLPNVDQSESNNESDFDNSIFGNAGNLGTFPADSAESRSSDVQDALGLFRPRSRPISERPVFLRCTNYRRRHSPSSEENAENHDSPIVTVDSAGAHSALGPSDPSATDTEGRVSVVNRLGEGSFGAAHFTPREVRLTPAINRPVPSYQEAISLRSIVSPLAAASPGNPLSTATLNSYGSWSLGAASHFGPHAFALVCFYYVRNIHVLSYLLYIVSLLGGCSDL